MYKLIWYGKLSLFSDLRNLAVLNISSNIYTTSIRSHPRSLNFKECVSDIRYGKISGSILAVAVTYMKCLYT